MTAEAPSLSAGGAVFGNSQPQVLDPDSRILHYKYYCFGAQRKHYRKPYLTCVLVVCEGYKIGGCGANFTISSERRRRPPVGMSVACCGSCTAQEKYLQLSLGLVSAAFLCERCGSSARCTCSSPFGSYLCWAWLCVMCTFCGRDGGGRDVNVQASHNDYGAGAYFADKASFAHHTAFKHGVHWVPQWCVSTCPGAGLRRGEQELWARGTRAHPSLDGPACWV